MNARKTTITQVTGSYYSYSGDEETLKGLVAKHGAVVTRSWKTAPR